MFAGRRALSGLVAVLAASALLAPESAAADSIAGTVSDENSHVGIAGVEVCPTPQPYTFEVSCTETDAGGHYSLIGLPPAQYTVYFSTQRYNLRHVGEFYAGKRYGWEADLFTLASPEEARSLDVGLAEGGSISGALADENSGQPIAGVRVCANDSEGIPARCADSDANGRYMLNGLRSGEYWVEFAGGNAVNYLRELYDDAENLAQAAQVLVSPPATTSDVNAALAPGAQILGHVSQVGTGIPIHDVFVCANELPPGERQGCDTTDVDGNYAIRSLPAATYLVAFEMEYMPFGLIADQWWDGVETMAEADPIAIAPPETRAGIDGQVTRGNWGPWGTPSEPAPAASPPTPPIATTSASKPRLGKCRKDSHRKWGKGKRRCVRKHGRHRRRHRRR
jgi:Carboxypeptidase regulatory-like domain